MLLKVAQSFRGEPCWCGGLQAERKGGVWTGVCRRVAAFSSSACFLGDKGSSRAMECERCRKAAAETGACTAAIIR